MKQTGDLYLLYVFDQWDTHHYIVFDVMSNSSTPWYLFLDELLQNTIFIPSELRLDLELITSRYTEQGASFFLTPIRSIDTILTDFPELVI